MSLHRLLVIYEVHVFLWKLHRYTKERLLLLCGPFLMCVGRFHCGQTRGGERRKRLSSIEREDEVGAGTYPLNYKSTQRRVSRWVS